MSTNIIDRQYNLINHGISLNRYSEHAKKGTLGSTFKTVDRTKIKNYRPISVLNIFSKTYERFLHENLTNYLDTFLSNFISAYCKSYRSNHALIRLI